MTPYECVQAKKLNQAIELAQSLANWRKRTGVDSFPEEALLQALIQRIEHTNGQFDRQLRHYQALAERRKQCVLAPDDSIRHTTSRLWEAIDRQFETGTVTHDLLRVLSQKIQRFPLPDFPVSRRKPVQGKDIHLYEDSYTLLGQYFSWLVELLQLVDFRPDRPTYYLHELSNQANAYNELTRQVGQEAITLRNLELTTTYLHKQLNQTVRAARRCVLTTKHDARHQ
ncbi:hypothetical protein [Spirosoma koreense]